MGTILPTTNRLTFTDKDDDLTIATDSAVKNGNGGAAYSMHTTATLGTVRAVIPVNGPSRHLTSYQTKLLAILGALLLLHGLLQEEKGSWI